jgi:ABC-type ATPase with predicted acetyltransferase domain
MRWNITSEDGEKAVNLWKCDKCGKIVKNSIVPNGWMLIRQQYGIEMDICLNCSTIVINHVLSLIADVKFKDD